MNYRHAFHAGNHGDVLKHAILARVLAYMTSKDKPMAVLDAHAGTGHYDLGGVEAFKTGEWRDGIGKLVAASFSAEVAGLLAPYLGCVTQLNDGGRLAHYPGSPEILRQMLRPADRLLLNELHGEDCRLLAQRFAGDGRVAVTAVDALQAIKAALPLRERRGLVLIDPAYEVPDETERVQRMVMHMMKRMATVSAIIWYPVTTAAFAESLCKAVEDAGVPETLRAELLVREPFEQAGLAGSGVLVVNPPWTLHDELKQLLPELARCLGTAKWGRGQVSWLTPPR